MNMTRAQLDALLRRNPQLSVDDYPPSAGLPSALAQCPSLPSLEPPASGQAGGLERPLVRITSCRCRSLDPDNLIGGAKALVDGLVASGLLPGDGPQDIDREYCQKKVKRRAEESTIVEIFY